MTLLLAVLFAALQATQPGTPSLTGTWEGSSQCTVPNSPCHDEHVVYHIKPDTAGPNKFTIDADKIVNGQEESMGTLQCSFTPEKSELFCDTSGEWRFRVAGDTMTGTLNLKNGTLYRKVSLKKR